MTINYKVFAAGDTLSANDVLTYLENQAVIKVDAASELPTLASTYPNVKVAYAADTDKVYVNDDGTYVALVTADGTVTLSNLTLTGNLTVQGTTTTIDSTTVAIKDKFVFEGATPDAFETELVVAEPTADRTVTIPDATTTLVGRNTTDTLTNKTISGASNTLSNIGNASLTNSSITLNGTPVSLGGTATTYSLPSQTGNSGKFLTTNGTTDSWGTVDLTSKTDKATLTTTGDIYYASSASTPARLGIGSTNQVLTVSGGVPTWATTAGGSLTPYCSVNANSTNITDNVATEVVFSNENFDSDNAYNTSTGRFTPQTAGKYFVTATIMVNANGTGIWHQGTVSLRKNGSEFARCDADFYISYAPYNLPQTVSSIIDCNGTTDYISTFVTLNVTSGGGPQYAAASRMVIYKVGA